MGRCVVRQATDNLREEHKIARRLRDIAKNCSNKIYAGYDIPFDDIRSIIIVIEEFIDRCHHGKEECAYFPATGGASTEMDEEARALVIEHELGRRIARFLDQSLATWRKDINAREPVARFLKAYVDFLDVHMEREERFFELVDKNVKVTEDAEREVMQKLHDEEEKLGSRYHELANLVSELEKREWMQ
jgi:hemerythrin-like domain-containing protein